MPCRLLLHWRDRQALSSRSVLGYRGLSVLALPSRGLLSSLCGHRPGPGRPLLLGWVLLHGRCTGP